MCLCIFDFWNFVSRWFGAYGCLFSEINQFALSAYSVPLPAVLICTYCFWNWTVSLPPFKFLCWSWPHWLRDVARFEGGASKEGIPLKWAVRVGSNLLTTEAPVRGSWHTMIQDWGSQRGETIWKQHQGGLLRAKVRRLQKNQPCQQFDLGLAACETNSLVETRQAAVLCYSGPGRPMASWSRQELPWTPAWAQHEKKHAQCGTEVHVCRCGGREKSTFYNY